MDKKRREEISGTFPAIIDKGVPYYTENVIKRYQLADQLMQSVREGNQYLALQAVRARSALTPPGRLPDELEEFKYDLIQIKSLLIQTLREIGVPELLMDAVHTEFTQKIYLAQSIEECKLLAEEMVRRFCGLNHLKSVQSYSMLVQKVILTVDVDLRQPLTLQYFAQRLNVNDSYLSNLFRKEVGMTLTDYVTTRRMERAMHLLAASQAPVKQVAKQVGIRDVPYFSRLFKKKTGMTPSEYRQQYRKSRL